MQVSSHPRVRCPAAVALAALVTALAGCGAPEPPAGLILITIDTCRADRIGCYDAGTVDTPFIDAVAERGVVFLDATAAAPLTLPSHCSILTGLYPDRHTIRDNGTSRLPDEARTLAEVLSDRGWRTAAFVSAVPVGSEFGADQGFSVYDDSFTASGGGAVMETEEAKDVADRFFFEERRGAQTADAALPWLREALAGKGPFFLWLHFFDPHAVYQPPPPHSQRYGPGSYEGEIAYVDEQVGRVMAALGDAEEHVTVVVTADHGESLGDHGERSHGLFIYESTLHVPWVMAGPNVPKGKRVSGAVSLVDVFPTVLEAAGVPVPEGVDGSSRLADAAAQTVPETDVFGECLLPRIHYNWAGLRSIRRGSWKLIDAPRPELFDLAEDPAELRDVSARHPDVVAELRGALDAHDSRGGVLSAESAEIDPLVREQLARLGYVGVSEETDATAEDDPWNHSGRDPKDMVEFFNRFQDVPTMMLEGRNDDAGRTLTELRALDPRNVRVIERLAMLRRIEERWDDVRDLCEEYLALNASDQRIRKNLAFARMRLGDTRGALDEYREVVGSAPEDADGWGLLGSLLSQEGHHEEAIHALAAAVELAPEDAGMRSALARAWGDSGGVDVALEEYGRALAIDPALPEAINGKALLLSHTGRSREAVGVLEEGLKRVGDDLDTMNNLAWILANESIDPARAYELASRAAQTAPDDPAVLDTLGWASIRSGRPADGIAALARAWELTGDVEVRAHLGVALAEAGRAGEGREHVRAAVEERPSLTSVPEIAKWR